MNSKIRSLIAVLFGAGVLVTPWFLGGNLPPVRTAALALTFVCGLVCIVFPSVIGTPTRIGMALKAVLLAGLAYAAFQILPINESTLSAYPAASRARICELLLGIGAFFVASFVFRDQRLLPWFLGLVALNGVLITLFGLAQNVSKTDRLFWFYELIHGGVPFGPFVNGNNAGGYLLLCFAAANFFLAQRIFRSQHLQRTRQDGPGNPSIISDALNRMGQAFATLETQQLYILAAIAAIAAGVMASMSRGAAVALLVSIFIGWGLLFRRSMAFGLVSIIVAGAGIGILVWTQQGEAVVSSLETITDTEYTNRNRIAHWQDAMQYAADSQPWGSGLGTYSLMYPPYQTTWNFNRWFKHAENQYLETFAELGIPGLVILLITIVIAVVASVMLLTKPDSTSRAVGLTGLIAITSQIVAGAFDFGLYQPANTLLMASLVGAVFSQLNWAWSAQHVAETKSAGGITRLAWPALLLTTLLTGWATYEYSAIDASTSVRRFNERFEPDRDRHLVNKYQQLGEFAVRNRPDDADAHYNLALNYILQYRLAASDVMVEEMKQTRMQLESETSEQQPQTNDQFESDQPETVSAILDRQAFVSTFIEDPALRRDEEVIEQPAFEEPEPDLNDFISRPAQDNSFQPKLEPNLDDSQQPIRVAQQNSETDIHGKPESQKDSVPNIESERTGSNAFGQPDLTPSQDATDINDSEADEVAVDDRQRLLQMLPEEFTFEQAWERSTLMSLNRLTWASKREGDEHLHDLQSSEPVQKYLTKAWEHLLLAEKYCDRFWMTHLRLANLCLLMNQGDREEEYLDKAISCCPNNSDLLFMVALTRHHAGQKDPAYTMWNKCLNLTREHDETIIQICRNEIGIKAFFDQVLPTEPYFRIRIAKRYFGAPEDALIKKLLMMHSKSKVDNHELSDAERQFVLAEMERLSGNYAVSLVYFKKALELENHRSDWRVQYARSLIAADMYDKAITELKVCELYHGNHHLVCQRLIRQAKRLRMERFRDNNDLEFGRN